ncbi:hypothetical protein ACL02U_12010 [Streptomyces sp. MS06]|uniref:hypothetical protein n=1 Tax=Streptomyces sp. MS06 TaxID=3385974 RepID=UPI0039A1B197
MIPASQPHEARYRHESDGRIHYTTKAVIAWDDDGYPLVVGRDGCQLVRANGWRNFHDVVPVDPPVTAAFPAAGWQVVYKDDDSAEYRIPLTAWLTLADGSLRPVDVGTDGFADDPTECLNFVRLVPPSNEAS